MSEQRFSPPPWRLDDGDIRDARDLLIATVYRWRCSLRDSRNLPMEANANLLCAAPDLLAACEAAERFITNGIEYGYIIMPDPGTRDAAHETPGIIRAAIAKAAPGDRGLFADTVDLIAKATGEAR